MINRTMLTVLKAIADQNFVGKRPSISDVVRYIRRPYHVVLPYIRFLRDKGLIYYDENSKWKKEIIITDKGNIVLKKLLEIEQLMECATRSCTTFGLGHYSPCHDVEMKPKPLDLGFNEILKIIKRNIRDFRKVHEIEKIIKQRIKQACEFYLRYKDKPELLYKEHPIYYDDINEIYKKDIELKEKAEHVNVWNGKSCFLEKYNEWLFKLAFKDVLGEKDD